MAAMHDDDDSEEDVPLAARRRPVAPAGGAGSSTSPGAAASGTCAAVAALSDVAKEFNLRPATASDAAAAYAAAEKQPGAPSLPTAEGSVKQVSFQFLRDRRDHKGRRPGDEGFDKTTIQVRWR